MVRAAALFGHALLHRLELIDWKIFIDAANFQARGFGGLHRVTFSPHQKHGPGGGKLRVRNVRRRRGLIRKPVFYYVSGDADYREPVRLSVELYLAPDRV
jgi:hypothetical protein